jgi:hypothetical protein
MDPVLMVAVFALYGYVETALRQGQ